MTNYFYTDANGQKQGPINDQLLQSLAAQGVITPHTSLETDTGHKGVAGQIPGLNFPAPSPSAQNTMPQSPSNSPTNEQQQSGGSGVNWWWWVVGGGIVGFLLMQASR